MIHFHSRKYIPLEINFDHYPHWKLVTAMWAMVAAMVGEGTASTITSVQSASAERKQQQSLYDAQAAAVTKAETKAASATSLAKQEASNTLKKQRLAQTNTILTSPLGIQDQATTIKSTLG